MPSTVDAILNNRDFSVNKLPGFLDFRHRTCGQLSSLQKTARSRRRSGAANSSRSSNGHEDTAWELGLASDVFSVREKLGEGGYGAVFRVALLPNNLDADDDEEEDDDDDLLQTALKVESPGSLWEFYALNLVHSRLDSRACRSIVKPHRLYAFEDETHLLLEYCDQGSLLDAVNNACEAGTAPAGSSGRVGFDETLAMFFTVELTRIIEALHGNGLLHGDFKIDNVLVRLEDPPSGNTRGWTPAYSREGTGGWACKGVKLIDFGRTIDLRSFPEGQEFDPEWTTDKHDCAEVREGRPWSYQPDYYGLACIAHVLLFGRYLEALIAPCEMGGRDRYVLKEPFKRYHQQALWVRFFDLLLNPCLARPDASLPLTNELAGIRVEMEDWLEANSEKSGKSLKGLLKKLEIHALASRR